MKKYLLALAAVLTAVKLYKKCMSKKVRRALNDLGGDV